jgi:hypothetical protein
MHRTNIVLERREAGGWRCLCAGFAPWARSPELVDERRHTHFCLLGTERVRLGAGVVGYCWQNLSVLLTC